MANDIRERVKAYNLTDELGNRAGDNWDPLFAIASAAGENWLQLVKKDAEEHGRNYRRIEALVSPGKGSDRKECRLYWCHCRDCRYSARGFLE